MGFIRDWQEFLVQFLVHIDTFNPTISGNYAQIKVVVIHFRNSLFYNSGDHSDRYFVKH